MGPPEQVALSQQQLSELEPQLRFARYQLQRSGQPADEAAALPDSPSAVALHVRSLVQFFTLGLGSAHGTQAAA